MRIGAAISVAAHVAALTACLVLAGVRPFDPTTAEAITVDIVTPEEAPPLPKEPDKYDFPTLSDKDQEQAAAEKKPAAQESQQPAEPEQTAKPAPAPPSTPKQDSRQAVAKQQPTEPPKPAEQPKSQPQQQAQPQQQQPPEQPQQDVPTAAPDITSKFGMMFTLPDAGAAGDFDAKATAKANISNEDAAALRAHLKTCSILPRSVSPTDNVSVVLRVALQRDGKLAAEPLLIQASASERGPALMRSAMDALTKCQPYTMLPADRYDQWRMLDLSFSPKDFQGR